jgi:hypothetical protein
MLKTRSSGEAATLQFACLKFDLMELMSVLKNCCSGVSGQSLAW